MADAADLKSAGVTPMWVRLPPALFDGRQRQLRKKSRRLSFDLALVYESDAGTGN